MTNDLFLTSIHESGHCVAVVAVGAVVDNADVRPIGNQAGQCLHTPIKDPFKSIIVCLAGPLGVFEYRRRRGERFDLSADSDMKKIDSQLDKVYGRDRPPRDRCPMFIEANRVTRRLVCRQYGAMLRIAEWLFLKRFITGRVTGHSPARSEGADWRAKLASTAEVMKAKALRLC